MAVGVSPLVASGSFAAVIGIRKSIYTGKPPGIYIAIIKSNLRARLLDRRVQRELYCDMIPDVSEFRPCSFLPARTCLEHEFGRRVF